jgi:hypothetical protein
MLPYCIKDILHLLSKQQSVHSPPTGQQVTAIGYISARIALEHSRSRDEALAARTYILTILAVQRRGVLVPLAPEPSPHRA